MITWCILKKFVSFIVILSLLSGGVLTAQNKISGTLKDAETKEPLIGANILVKGTTTGTVTDYDGHYNLEIPKGYNRVIFSYTGYQPVEITVRADSTVHIELMPGKVLQEVVLIGYGQVKREDVTGALQSISSEDFNQGAITGAQELLSGKIPGVRISTDGSPGGGSAIRIRGESSLSATNDPLIVIDGVPLDNGGISGGRNNLNVVNPADIETITVLKDASATAIYGNRASAGVILITTKKGKLKDGLKFGFESKISSGGITGKVDVLTASEFSKLIQEKYEQGSEARLLLGSHQTDWQDEIYHKAIGQDYILTASGGVADIPFRISMGYTDKNGLLKTDNFNRLSANLRLNPGFINNTLQFNIGLKAASSRNHFADHGAIGSAVGFDPTQPIFSDSEDYGGYFAWRNPQTGKLTGLAPANPVALLYQKEDNSSLNRYIANASIDYRFWFLPELRANLNLGYDFSESSGSVFIDTSAAFASSYNDAKGIDEGGVNNSYSQNKKNSLLEFYLNYKKELFGNEFDVMAGYSWQHFINKNTFKNANLIESIVSEGEDAAELYMLSLFGRINYNIENIAYITATLRQDHTSRFAPKNRVGLFPAVGVAFPLINNDRQLFNKLKARIGWGITGQQDIGGYYLYQGLYQKSFDNARYQLGDDFITTFRPNGYDSGIRWETTTTYNAGTDFSIVKDRLSSSVDVYLKRTKDLLNFNVQVPVGSNLTNVVATNIGSMESKGLEVSVDIVPYKTEYITWQVSANAAINRSKITKLNNADETSIGEEVGGISGGVGNTIQVLTVGYEPYAFYVYQQKYGEDGKLLPGQFVDRNGDSIVNELDKYRIETANPKWVLGISSRFRYKNLSLSFAGRSHLGHQIYNNVQTGFGYQDRLFDLGVLKNVHRSGIANNVQEQGDILFSDAYIQDASFFRMDHITLGYNIQKIMGIDVNLYATLQNAFVITPYKGLDPEVFRGIDNNLYPRPRTWVFGLQLSF